jgi:hypothetical protein
VPPDRPVSKAKILGNDGLYRKTVPLDFERSGGAHVLSDESLSELFSMMRHVRREKEIDPRGKSFGENFCDPGEVRPQDRVTVTADECRAARNAKTLRKIRRGKTKISAMRMFMMGGKKGKKAL